MLKVLQNYNNGKIELADIDLPEINSNEVLIENIYSLISSGTEKSIISLSKKNILQKAIDRKDLTKRVFEKVKSEGLISTINLVKNKLDIPIPLGYSCVGKIIKAGENIKNFSEGDYVVTFGDEAAHHAEFIKSIEQNIVRVNIDDDLKSLTFSMIGAIALHAIRKSKINNGEVVLVVGLGLIGILMCQILQAYSYSVVGYDIDINKVKKAKQIGIINVTSDLETLKNLSNYHSQSSGFDGTFICSANSSEPFSLAVEHTRYSGKIVLVGTGNIEFDRNEMWRKEIEFLVSKAAGYGNRWDSSKNFFNEPDKHIIRWTQKRNVEEIIRLIIQKKINCKELISEEHSIKNAILAYQNLINNHKLIATIFNYPKDNQKKDQKMKIDKVIFKKKENNQLSTIIGTGNFATSIMIPKIVSNKYNKVNYLFSNSGEKIGYFCKKYNIQNGTTSFENLIDKEFDNVFILTRHDSHFELVKKFLLINKNVFVEKPLAINKQQLNQINQIYKENNSNLFVGHNRIYSSHVKKIKKFLDENKMPLAINVTICPGKLDQTSWILEEKHGGGRIVGELSHFIDLIYFLTDSIVIDFSIKKVSNNNPDIINKENFILNFKLKNGSVCCITYISNSDRSSFRENYKIFGDNFYINSTDFKKTELINNGKKKIFKTFSQDLGYENEIEEFLTENNKGHSNIKRVDRMFDVFDFIFKLK